MGDNENIFIIRKRDICIFIWNNYTQQLKLSRISQSLSISERSCERIIHDHLHTTVKYLINAVRFYKTIEHYERVGGNIVQAAIENGFSDRQNFNTWWNRLMKVPFDHQNFDAREIKKEASSEYTELIEKILAVIPENLK